MLSAPFPGWFEKSSPDTCIREDISCKLESINFIVIEKF